jgi:hypothetical protein
MGNSKFGFSVAIPLPSILRITGLMQAGRLWNIYGLGVTFDYSDRRTLAMMIAWKKLRIVRWRM